MKKIQRRIFARIHLQIYQFWRTRYDPVTHKWLCGHSMTGTPCNQGPDKAGHCHASFACEPHRKQQRWYCTRSVVAGGSCKPGPFPDGTCCERIQGCDPIRSLRGKRGMAIRYVLAFSFLTLLLLIVSKFGLSFISPGDLSVQHSHLNNDCTECHTNAKSSPAAWPENAFHSGTLAKDSRQCLECHNLGEYAFETHTADPMKIHTLQEAVFDANPAAVDNSSKQVSLNCSACHIEHKGLDNNLTAMTEQQCQRCHSAHFNNFADNHPKFGMFPYSRRPHLMFDHVTHIKKYFIEEKADVPCANCHQPGAAGIAMRTLHYNKICQSCHDVQITGEDRTGDIGILMFAVPGIDFQSLEDSQLGIGYWPEDAEGELTPLIKMLLSIDDDYEQMMEMLADVDLLDLSDATNEQKQAAEKLAWKFKQLLADLASQGQLAISERLAKRLGKDQQEKINARLSRLIQGDVFMNAQHTWFPKLEMELIQHEKKAVIPKTKEPERNESDIDPVKTVFAGGWYRMDESYELFYRPSGHADPVLRSWIDVALKSNVEQDGTTKYGIRELLTHNKQAGACMKCHSISKVGEQHVANWEVRRPSNTDRSFTVFNHHPHLGKMTDKECSACHVLDKDSEFLESYKTYLNHQYQSNFKDVEVDDCSSCHNRNAVGEMCTTCHRYHDQEILNGTHHANVSGSSR